MLDDILISKMTTGWHFGLPHDGLLDGILVSWMISPDGILVTGCLDWMALWPPVEDVTGVRSLIRWHFSLPSNLVSSLGVYFLFIFFWPFIAEHQSKRC